MKTIYFTRHGECVANAEGLLAGSTNDSPLTEKGKQQARDAVAEFVNRPVDLIVSSPLVRAAETAQILADGIGYLAKIEHNPLMKERDMGSASGQPVEKAFELLDNGKATGVEPASHLRARTQDVIDWLKTLPAQHILLVSHSGFGKMLQTILDGGDPERFFEAKHHENGAVWEFKL